MVYSQGVEVDVNVNVNCEDLGKNNFSETAP
jgi:hypothetical protein